MVTGVSSQYKKRDGFSILHRMINFGFDQFIDRGSHDHIGTVIRCVVYTSLPLHFDWYWHFLLNQSAVVECFRVRKDMMFAKGDMVFWWCESIRDQRHYLMMSWSEQLGFTGVRFIHWRDEH